jgi:hypothetical protein
MEESEIYLFDMTQNKAANRAPNKLVIYGRYLSDIMEISR